jgi:hypothetical protein
MDLRMHTNWSCLLLMSRMTALSRDNWLPKIDTIVGVCHENGHTKEKICKLDCINNKICIFYSDAYFQDIYTNRSVYSSAVHLSTRRRSIVTRSNSRSMPTRRLEQNMVTNVNKYRVQGIVLYTLQSFEQYESTIGKVLDSRLELVRQMSMDGEHGTIRRWITERWWLRWRSGHIGCKCADIISRSLALDDDTTLECLLKVLLYCC